MPANMQVRYPETAQRIADKIRQNPQIPQGYGRDAWFIQEFKRKFDVVIKRETMRTWLNGLREPRHEHRAMLAEVLGVDAGWLYTGFSAPVVGHTAFSASEMVVALMLRSAGWAVRAAEERTYDLDAELRGRRYKIECTQAVPKDEAFEVKLSKHAMSVVTLATFVDPNRGELSLLVVEGEPGEIVRFTIDEDNAITAENGEVRWLTDLTKPI